MKLVITIENRDPLVPSKSTKPMDAEETLIHMRELVFRLACGEYSAVYVTREEPFRLKEMCP